MKTEIRERSDAGEPVAARDGPEAAPFMAIATAVRAGLDAAKRPAPRLVKE